MMENENMINNVEVTELIPAEADFSAGLSTGTAMLIGAALTAGVMFGVKMAKKAIDKHKAKKAEAKVIDDCEDEE